MAKQIASKGTATAKSWGMQTKFLIISGTPGTGKSAASRLLARRMRWQHIDLGKLALRKRIIKGFDRHRNVPIVDLWGIRTEVMRVAHSTSSEVIILDGSYSHLVPIRRGVLAVVVLRCNPGVLARRLRGRRWGEAKIRENVQSEMLDVCKSEALGMHKIVREIDTTGMSAKRICNSVIALYEGGFPRTPTRDWLAESVHDRRLLRWMV